MQQRDSTAYTFTVAAVLCVVCSVLVSASAVILKPLQDRNKALDRKKNILVAAGYEDEIKTNEDIDRIFDERIEESLIDLATGDPVSEEQLSEHNLKADTYDARKAAKDPQLQRPVEPDGALPGIMNVEPYARVYSIVEGGESKGYIFPVYAKGLWSTLYGFLAVESDAQTVRGITFYEHAETPGLGGEVDNPNWKKQWREDKKIYDEQGEVALKVVKGKGTGGEHSIDGLSGATITTKGVNNLVQYWMGPNAYGKFLENKRQ